MLVRNHSGSYLLSLNGSNQVSIQSGLLIARHAVSVGLFLVHTTTYFLFPITPPKSTQKVSPRFLAYSTQNHRFEPENPEIIEFTIFSSNRVSQATSTTTRGAGIVARNRLPKPTKPAVNPGRPLKRARDPVSKSVAL
jgi:hypothetical protein